MLAANIALHFQTRECKCLIQREEGHTFSNARAPLFISKTACVKLPRQPRAKREVMAAVYLHFHEYERDPFHWSNISIRVNEGGDYRM
jgi:hypothetical protein